MKQDVATRSVVDTYVTIKNVQVSAYTIPAATPESDGTIAWNSTTLVLVELEAAGTTGMGYTYASEAAAQVINSMLKPVVLGKNVMDIPAINRNMIMQIRNQGTGGIAMMAVSAVDTALWDLKAKLLNVPLFSLLGKANDSIQVYGSGGFTSYTEEQLQLQLGNWASCGMHQVKMKVGQEADKDVLRVALARKAIGPVTELFVDANGAYTTKQALRKAYEFAEYNVCWFEEPVSSDNLHGLHFIRQKAPAGMQVAAGEYGYQLGYFNTMLGAQAVDVLQADATRCGGITGFLKAGHLAEANDIPFSAHCAPALHLHAALALPSFYTAEYFYDHALIESRFFDGCPQVKNGYMQADDSRPGLGLAFKHQDAARYKL